MVRALFPQIVPRIQTPGRPIYAYPGALAWLLVYRLNRLKPMGSIPNKVKNHKINDKKRWA